LPSVLWRHESTTVTEFMVRIGFLAG
jgi:hypothetical protein